MADEDIMSIDSVSNDGYTEEDFEQAANEKPLMTLFKRLIGNDSKENTVLTNAQIIDILKKEFDMDLSYIHDLEIEIYLNLMKKYLKDWPLWDEFDQSIQTLKSKNDTTSIKKKLETNHKNLKAYLSKMLEAAKPFMKNVVESTKESTSKKKIPETADGDEVVLEVQCSRQQLNQLFFRRPHPDFNNSIFNVQIPNKITVNRFSLRAILNWPGIKIRVNLGALQFDRKTVHQLRHKLVNKKLNYIKEEPIELDVGLQMKDLKPWTHKFTIKDICKIFSKYTDLGYNEQQVVKEVSELLSLDFAKAPDVNISPMFRRNLNKYPYARYLYTDVNTKQSCSSNLYDLQLEETMIPISLINIMKFEKIGTHANLFTSLRSPNWLMIDCTYCNVAFSSNDSVGLWQHFESEHQGEPDWHCTNCNKSFEVNELAELHWRHECYQ